MPQFEALHAQVVGVSTDPAPSLAAWQKENNAGGKQILLLDPSGNVVELFQPAGS